MANGSKRKPCGLANGNLYVPVRVESHDGSVIGDAFAEIRPGHAGYQSWRTGSMLRARARPRTTRRPLLGAHSRGTTIMGSLAARERYRRERAERLARENEFLRSERARLERLLGVALKAAAGSDCDPLVLFEVIAAVTGDRLDRPAFVVERERAAAPSNAPPPRMRRRRSLPCAGSLRAFQTCLSQVVCDRLPTCRAPWRR